MRQEICSACPIYNDGLIQLGVRKNICGAARYVVNEDMPSVLLMAEAFGQDEDNVNLPLVGRSGKLLDQLLTESGLINYNLKYDNSVKCRPIKFESGKYKNRTPTDEEVACCRPYLEDTLAFNPDIIVLLGRTPFKALFPDKEPAQYRGKGIIYNHNGKDIVAVSVYHPAACLYNPNNKPVLLRHLTNIRLYLESPKDGIEQSAG